MNKSRCYVGNFKNESKQNGGWFMGCFLNDLELRERSDIEIKFWEFPPGEVFSHEIKFLKKATEITLVLEGKLEGMLDEEMIKLEAGDYVIITPQTINGFPQKVLEYTKGLTIKLPSLGATDKVGAKTIEEIKQKLETYRRES